MRAISILMISSLVSLPAAAEPPANAARLPPTKVQGKPECSAFKAVFAQAAVTGERLAFDTGPRKGEAVIYFINGRGRFCTWYGLCSMDPFGPCKHNKCTTGRLSRGSGNSVVLEFTSEQPMPAREMFHIERNMPIPAVTARQLGARGALVLRKGKYRPTLANGGRMIRVELPVSGGWGPSESDAGA